MAKDRVAVKGRWFGGDRTIEQQLTGLDYLWPELPEKTVIDVGCAEGEISMACARRGALLTIGLEIREDAVKAATAKAARESLPVHFECRDVNALIPNPGSAADIVLMLAILHKLRYPPAAAARFASIAQDLVVVRLPPKDQPWIITDARSGNKPHDVGSAILAQGFLLEKAGNFGPFGEWMGFYRRTKA